MPVAHCPTLLIASPSSGQGKTLFTSALARAHTQQGRKVAVFKLGPDFLDPMIHQVACGQTVYNLDLWMMGEQHCQELLYKAARDNDIILIESLMGLHDNLPSSADFARLFNIPVLLLMDVAKYAQTAAAIADGLINYQSPVSVTKASLTLFGIVGNKVGSDNHHLLLKESLSDSYLASIKRDESLHLPHRHLGLVQAGELDDLTGLLNYAANELINTPFISDRLLQLPAETTFQQVDSFDRHDYLKGKCIAIAKDAAFSFIYPANIDFIIHNGARIKYFSPLKNQAVPDADILWLPGGYPELYLTRLQQNAITRQSIQSFCNTNKPVLAECGGFIYLLETLSTDNSTANMCNVIPGNAQLHSRFQGLGLQSMVYNNKEYRGHSFHHTSVSNTEEPMGYTTMQNGKEGEAVYQFKNITGTYFHQYFAYSNNILLTQSI